MEARIRGVTYQYGHRRAALFWLASLLLLALLAFWGCDGQTSSSPDTPPPMGREPTPGADYLPVPATPGTNTEPGPVQVIDAPDRTALDSLNAAPASAEPVTAAVISLPTLPAQGDKMPTPVPTLSPEATPFPTAAPLTPTPSPPASVTPTEITIPDRAAMATPVSPAAQAENSPAVPQPEAYKEDCELSENQKANLLFRVEGAAASREATQEVDALWRFAEADNQGFLRDAWGYANHPVLADGTVYFGTAATGCLYAIDANTGEPLWVHRGGDELGTAPLVANGVVYVAPGRTRFKEGIQVHALESVTGKVLWEFETRGRGTTSPVLDEGRVIFSTEDPRTDGGRVIALDAATGEVSWIYSRPERIYSVLAQAGKVYILTGQGTLTALDGHRDSTLWRHRLREPGSRYLTFYEDILLANFGWGKFLAVNKDTAQVLWKRDLEGSVDSQPLAVNGVIYIATSPGYLNALDIRTGEAYWRYGYERGGLDSPAMAGDQIVVGTDAGYLLSINSKTGQVLKARVVGAPVNARPAVTDQGIIVSNVDDILLAVERFDLATRDGSVSEGEPELDLDGLLWVRYTGKPELGTPWVRGDKLFLAVSGNRLVTLNRKDGKILWRADNRSKWLMYWVSTGDEAVFLPSSRERMAAMDSDTGELLWEYHAGSAVPAFPLVGDNSVFLKSEDKMLHALDRTSGELRWKFDTRDDGRVWPNESDGLVYFGDGAGFIYGLDEYTGEERWKLGTRHGLRGLPYLSGDFLCFLTGAQSLVALNRWTGEKAWERELGATTDTITVDNGVAYAATWEEKVYAIEVESGTMLWTADLNHDIASGTRVSVADGVVIAGASYYGYTAYDGATGEELWDHSEGKGGNSTPWPVTAEGIAFIGSRDGKLTARDLRTGEVLQTYDTGHFRSSPGAVSDGVAYLHGGDGYAYALDVSDAFGR